MKNHKLLILVIILLTILNSHICLSEGSTEKLNNMDNTGKFDAELKVIPSGVDTKVDRPIDRPPKAEPSPVREPVIVEQPKAEPTPVREPVIVEQPKEPTKEIGSPILVP